jgi:hypothetical protein
MSTSQQPKEEFCLADWAISPEDRPTDASRGRDEDHRRFQSPNIICLDQYRRQQQNKKNGGIAISPNAPERQSDELRRPMMHRYHCTLAFLDNVDGRSVLASRYRDILGQLVSDIGGDPSEAQSICRRAATLAVWVEQAESAMAGGAALNIAEFTTAVNTMHRVSGFFR